jgi:hypothetical protein
MERGGFDSPYGHIVRGVSGGGCGYTPSGYGGKVRAGVQECPYGARPTAPARGYERREPVLIAALLVIGPGEFTLERCDWSRSFDSIPSLTRV